MSNIKEIIENLAAYTRNSGFTVDVNNSLSTVSIANNEGEGFFLQGHEAQEFIDDCKQLAETHDINVETVFLSTAKNYIDCL